jgi:hypothetical protein
MSKAATRIPRETTAGAFFTQPRQTAKVIIAKPHTIAAIPSQKIRDHHFAWPDVALFSGQVT